VLEAKMSEYLLLARKNKNNWFLGALTDWTERDMEVDFSFLDEGNFTAEIWQDGTNADKHAADYKKIVVQVNSQTKLPIHLAPGGGWAAIVYPEKNK
jgi:alpha-glucosidase